VGIIFLICFLFPRHDSASFWKAQELKPFAPHLEPLRLQTIDSKYAYATFLASDGVDSTNSSINDDKYFVATRILAYQLLHAPETKTNHDYPFIVLVNKGVSEAKRDRLRRWVGQSWIATRC
jgi:alpha-N-acetylglucosamine transferase